MGLAHAALGHDDRIALAGDFVERLQLLEQFRIDEEAARVEQATVEQGKSSGTSFKTFIGDVAGKELSRHASFPIAVFSIECAWRPRKFRFAPQH